MTYNVRNLTLHADGAEISSQACSGNITINTSPLIMGYCFDGTMDEARIYSRALDAGKIYCHYKRRKYPPEEPEVYTMKEKLKP